MILILTAITLMGVYQENPVPERDPLNPTDPSVVEPHSKKAIVEITCIGALSALCFSFEALLIKWLAVRGVPGADGGVMTLFFDGIYGLIMLTILTCIGDGLYLFTFWEIVSIVFAGTCTAIAIVLVNYSVANGIAGISFSMANSFPAWHSIFNFVFLSQMLSVGQVFGIMMAVSGSIILSIPEYLDCFAEKKTSDDYKVLNDDEGLTSLN